MVVNLCFCDTAQVLLKLLTGLETSPSKTRSSDTVGPSIRAIMSRNTGPADALRHVYIPVQSSSSNRCSQPSVDNDHFAVVA